MTRGKRRASAELPAELRALVSHAVAELGRMIREDLGAGEYARVERLRRAMAGLRDRSASAQRAVLSRELERLRREPPERQFHLAHSFALMLELMNACESAYRTHRLRLASRGHEALELKVRPRITFVLTAHPTEARSSANIAVFHSIQQLLTEVLETGWNGHKPRFHHLLRLAWHVAAFKGRRPTVADEAEHIYSILLREESLRALLQASVGICPVFIRSWVGGDKDGHPGVTERAMLESLELSREHLIRFTRARIAEARDSARMLACDEIIALCARFERQLLGLRGIRAGDGARVERLRACLAELACSYRARTGAEHPALLELAALDREFPGWVVPLELRESADVLEQPHSREARPIARMLELVERVSRGGRPRHYVQGFVISMVMRSEHLLLAMRFERRAFRGKLPIPIIPLFEQLEPLERGPEILAEALGDRVFREAVRGPWRGRLEIMLGYSDSAKQVGVLASRMAIARAVASIDALCRARRLTPSFFHGSGGSVDRGGGSLQEQTEWWPRTAILHPKSTVQGEMIERTFASPEIFKGQILKLAQRANGREGRARPAGRDAAVRAFTARVRDRYVAEVKRPEFLRLVEHATAYRWLSALRIGSRPQKRAVRRPGQGAIASISALRAIPWVLSWTQTRILFPTWWGVGSAWAETPAPERARLKRAFKTDPVLAAFVKVLGFTLKKVEFAIWELYVNESSLDPAEKKAVLARFGRELAQAADFVRALSGSDDLVWFRPWLGESIRLRSPMIHPLNLLQIVGLERRDLSLIRETATGIASGMMTTG